MPPPYHGVGFCIYCGVAEAQSGPKGLSDEHIVPFCLGGKVILPKSSCEACAVITSAFEGDCAATVLAPARKHFHWTSRKSKKPTKTRAFTGNGSETSAVDITIQEDPAVVSMPEFGPPAALTGEKFADGMYIVGVNAFFREKSLEKMDDLAKKDIFTATMFNPSSFTRTLAKIGHSYAVAEFGLDGFKPLLNAPILNDAPFAGNFVGSMFGASTTSAELHEVDLVQYGEHVVAKVRLYAKHNCPPYFVVVGTL